MKTQTKTKTKQRRYYAAYAPYGTHITYNDAHVPVLHTFTDKKKRDEWIEHDNLANIMREVISAETFHKWKKYATIIEHD